MLLVCHSLYHEIQRRLLLVLQFFSTIFFKLSLRKGENERLCAVESLYIEKKSVSSVFQVQTASIAGQPLIHCPPGLFIYTKDPVCTPTPVYLYVLRIHIPTVNVLFAVCGRFAA